MKANPEMQPYYDIWFGLKHLYEQWAKRFDLTSHAMFVLYCIAQGEGRCTQKQICEQLLLPKQTVHTILNGFERKGWLVRQVMELDKRNKNLMLTPERRRIRRHSFRRACKAGGKRHVPSAPGTAQGNDGE